MAPRAKLYTKLPGRGIRRAIVAVAATRCRLWLGADHLLAVDGTTASEEYRRFYFRDIEAFVIRRTRGRQTTNWVLLALALITVGPLLYGWRTEGSAAWVGGAITFGVLWGILALVNTLRGPTCETKVRTAVQIEHLPSLGRLPVARKVLELLGPLITAAQGAATPEELSAAPWMNADGGRHATPLRHDHGRIHYALFSVLVADAIFTAMAFGFFRAGGSAPAMINSLMTLSSFLLSVIALMRQGGTDLPGAVRVATKSALVLNLLGFIVGIVFTVIYSVRHPGLQARTGLDFIHEPGFETVTMIAAGMSAIIGLAGFLAMRAPRTPPPAA